MVDGVAPGLVFAAVMPDVLSGQVGLGVVSLLAVSFMLGVYLRATALLLAALVLSSGILGAFQAGSEHVLGMVWQDVILICALLQSYAGIRQHDMHKAALVSLVPWRGHTTRLISKDIKPRRVRPIAGRASEDRPDPVLRPLIAPTERMRVANRTPCSVSDRNARMEDAEDVNIFADF